MDRYSIGPADGGLLPTEKGGGAGGGEKTQTRKALSAADGAGGGGSCHLGGQQRAVSGGIRLHRRKTARRLGRRTAGGTVGSPREAVWTAAQPPAGGCAGGQARRHLPVRRHDGRVERHGVSPAAAGGTGGDRPGLLRHRQPRVGLRSDAGDATAAGGDGGDVPLQHLCAAGAERGHHYVGGHRRPQRLRRPEVPRGGGR